MRPLCTLLLLLVTVAAADAQAQFPASTPPPAWGGHMLSPQVPYQPTLPAESISTSPVITNEWPTSEDATEQIWSAYPAAPEAYTLGGQPVAAPGVIVPEPIYPPTPEPSLRESLIPPDAREGFFQKAKFTTTWMPQLQNDSLGWTDLRSEVVTALPFFTRENPIIITPSYELHFLDRPEGFDLPPRLHDLAMDFHVFRVFGNHWIFDAAVTPGLYADDYSFDSDDALRVNGRAVAVYAPTLDWKWVLGVTYVNGGWAKIVPIVGVVYEPNDDVKYELVFPRPRVAWRLPQSPVPGRDEYWFYLLGEFGNAIWAFEQNDGTPDVLASRDFRFILGLERKVVGGISYKTEFGYIFNRDIKVASVSGDDIGLDDTFLLRAGIAY